MKKDLDHFRNGCDSTQFCDNTQSIKVEDIGSIASRSAEKTYNSYDKRGQENSLF